jgi:hypothetical protein
VIVTDEDLNRLDTELETLLETAREYRAKHGFSDEERRQQIRSFAYGNVKLHNSDLTEEMIDKAMGELEL